jgi:hypothetical protein
VSALWTWLWDLTRMTGAVLSMALAWVVCLLRPVAWVVGAVAGALWGAWRAAGGR